MKLGRYITHKIHIRNHGILKMDGRSNSNKHPSKLQLWSNNNMEAAIRAVTNGEMGVMQHQEVSMYQQPP